MKLHGNTRAVAVKMRRKERGVTAFLCFQTMRCSSFYNCIKHMFNKNDEKLKD